jgi:LmbE family N-acetylglucosaminyl deacetylase
MAALSTDYPASALALEALVFAPHFDDETLGCGGIIARKRRVGARVGIVFMTDGAASYGNLLDGRQLGATRASEAAAAARVLGVPEDDVVCLGLPDGHLSEHWELALERIKRILSDSRPREVFAPYSAEPSMWSEDHAATTEITLQALREIGHSTIVYEYPVWFWLHWPWVRWPTPRRYETRWILRNTVTFRFGTRAARDFRCRHAIADLLDTKRAALEQHRSQMVALVRGRPTLPDIAGGDFLQCFFQQNEFFRRSPLFASSSRVG